METYYNKCNDINYQLIELDRDFNPLAAAGKKNRPKNLSTWHRWPANRPTRFDYCAMDG